MCSFSACCFANAPLRRLVVCLKGFDVKKPLRNPEIVWRVEKRRQAEVLSALEQGEDVGEAGTVILLQSGMMHQLNLIGGMIWKLCDGSRDLDAVVDELSGEFEVERSELYADAEEFVNDLVDRGWLKRD